MVHNNRKGKDAEILKQFNEQSWNNPVVRYLDFSGKDVIQRKDRVWTTGPTIDRMVAALKASKRDVPRFLESLATSHPSQSLKPATFAMHCYWEGEAKLGSIAGVSSTRSAWHAGLEVVTLNYDPSIVEYAKLVEVAQSFECASKVFAHTQKQLSDAKSKVGDKAVVFKADSTTRDAKASDQKYYLLQTPLRHLPLTETQATKINSSLGFKKPYAQWLSPKQRELAKRIVTAVKKSPGALDELHYPRQVSELAQYSATLNDKLAELEK